MPQPPGGRGQQSIFSFAGFQKFVEVNGVRHAVVPTAVPDFDIDHPLVCRWGCGERFRRGTAKASHERHCKRKPRVPNMPRPAAPAVPAAEVDMEETVPAVPALPAVPGVPNVGPPPGSLEVHRVRLGENGLKTV